MENLFFKIAGFNILISLKRASDLKNKQVLQHEIKYHLKDFSLESRHSRVDFEVEVNDLIPKPEKNNPLSTLFAGKSKLITSYSIGYFIFQLILQNILYKLLSDNDGFFIHASAANINGRAYIFTGGSGAGKSTVVKLLSERFQPLSDDLSIIRKVDGKFFYFQHPILEKNSIENKSSKPYPLGKICFLKKSNLCRVYKITDKELVFKKFAKQLRAPDKKNLKTFTEYVLSLDQYYTLMFSKDISRLFKLKSLN